MGFRDSEGANSMPRLRRNASADMSSLMLQCPPESQGDLCIVFHNSIGLGEFLLNSMHMDKDICTFSDTQEFVH